MKPAAPNTAQARVMFVDDEPDFLAAIGRSLRSCHFQLTTATSGKQALEILKEQGPFAVLVSDLRMPGISGVELLRQARLIAPDTCRVLFTGQLDIEHALSAVNEGAIFRFMVKPCASIVVANTILSAIDQYRLVTAERVLLEQTLRGSIRALTEVLALASPVAFGRANRLRESATALVAAMHIPNSWDVEIAAMLSQIGAVTLPPATLEKLNRGEALVDTEVAMMARLPFLTEQVLSHIPRLEPVLEILRHSHARFDGAGVEEGEPFGGSVPWGSRALKAILDLDVLESESESPSLAFDALLCREGWYDPAIVKALGEIRAHQRQAEVRELSLSALKPGMILAKDIRAKNGSLYLARGQEITASALEKLRNWSLQLQDAHTLRVVVRRTSAPAVLED